MTVTHFIPLLGSFYLAQDKYNELYDDKLISKYYISFDVFKNNEFHLSKNRKVLIDYIPNEISFNENSYYDYKNIIEQKNINSTNLMLSIPPCGGLSFLNRSNRSHKSLTNRFIFECVKWYLAQDNDILIMENAPDIFGKEGSYILKNIENVLLSCEKNKSSYKINVVKVNTINYGLPQYRLRSFIIISKSNKSFLLKNYNNDKFVAIEEFLKNIELKDNDIDNVSLDNKYVLSILQYLNKFNIIDEIIKNNSSKPEYAINTWRYLLNEFEKNNNIFGNDVKLKKKAEFIKSKLDKNLNFWDISPCVIKGKISAITGKSIFNTIHPNVKPYRVLNVRELMSLMGIPKDFYIYNPIKNINHLCQSIPINTSLTAIRWGIDILKNNVYNNTNEFITYQNYSKRNLSGDCSK